MSKRRKQDKLKCELLLKRKPTAEEVERHEEAVKAFREKYKRDSLAGDINCDGCFIALHYR